MDFGGFGDGNQKDEGQGINGDRPKKACALQLIASVESVEKTNMIIFNNLKQNPKMWAISKS